MTKTIGKLKRQNKIILKKFLKEEDVKKVGPHLLFSNCEFFLKNYLHKSRVMPSEIKYINDIGAKVSYYNINDELIIKIDHMDKVDYDPVDIRYMAYEGIVDKDGERTFFYYTKTPIMLTKENHLDGFVFDGVKFLPAFREEREQKDLEILNFIEKECEKKETQKEQNSILK